MFQDLAEAISIIILVVIIILIMMVLVIIINSKYFIIATFIFFIQTATDVLLKIFCEFLVKPLS